MMRLNAGEDLRNRGWKAKLIVLAATGGGLGFLPFMPGTFGTIGAIPVVLLMSKLAPVFYALGAAAFILLSFRVCSEAERIFASKDPSKVVIDEIAGTMVTFFWVPISPATVLVGFLLFRLFDIIKPFPAGYFDRSSWGGVSVVLDDVAAGVYANVALRVIILITGGSAGVPG